MGTETAGLGPTDGQRTDPRGKETARTGNSWTDGRTEPSLADRGTGTGSLRTAGVGTTEHPKATVEKGLGERSHSQIWGCKEHLKGSAVTGGDPKAVTRDLGGTSWHCQDPAPPVGGNFGREMTPHRTKCRNPGGMMATTPGDTGTRWEGTESPQCHHSGRAGANRARPRGRGGGTGRGHSRISSRCPPTAP